MNDPREAPVGGSDFTDIDNRLAAVSISFQVTQAKTVVSNRFENHSTVLDLYGTSTYLAACTSDLVETVRLYFSARKRPSELHS